MGEEVEGRERLKESLEPLEIFIYTISKQTHLLLSAVVFSVENDLKGLK